MYILYYSYNYSKVVEDGHVIPEWEDGYIQTHTYDDACEELNKLKAEHGDAFDYYCIAKVIEDSIDIPRRTEGAANDRLPPSALDTV